MKIEEQLLKIEERVLKIKERLLKIEERLLKIEERLLKIEERYFQIEEWFTNSWNGYSKIFPRFQMAGDLTFFEEKGEIENILLEFCLTIFQSKYPFNQPCHENLRRGVANVYINLASLLFSAEVNRRRRDTGRRQEYGKVGGAGYLNINCTVYN